MHKTARVSILSLAFLFLFGCATLPPNAKRDPRDPWERVNRTTYKFNDGVDRYVLKPVAKGYAKVTPSFVQRGVSNFFDNLNYPVTIVNDLLQAQFKAFASDTGRLVLNTTVGIGGFFDPATAAGLDKNSRDFGQTLGKWGLRPGPYLVIPILGPSDVRDAVGRVGDEYTNPRHYINNTYVNWGLVVAGGIDTRTRLLGTDQLIQSAYDPYAFIRNAYLQRRQFLVTGESGPSLEEQQQEDKLFEEAGEEDQTQKQPAPPKNNPPPQQPQSNPQPPPPPN
jgi:phospholipid-binding lipoprotein MlaA